MTANPIAKNGIAALMSSGFDSSLKKKSLRKIKTTTRLLNKSDNKLLGTVLVVPKESDQNLLMTSIDLNIFGLIANTEAEAGTDFKMEVTADLTNAQGGGLTLGDSYEILLYFDEDQIEITASKVPWEEGGNILVPIHPIPDVS